MYVCNIILEKPIYADFDITKLIKFLYIYIYMMVNINIFVMKNEIQGKNKIKNIKRYGEDKLRLMRGVGGIASSASVGWNLNK